MRSAIFVMVFTFLLASECLAQMNTNVTVYGAGTKSCDSYVIARKDDNKAVLLQYNQWIYGYFTAVSLYDRNAEDKSLIDSESPEGLFLWLDKWCASNPLSNLFVAVNSMIDELLPPPAPPKSKIKK